MIEYTTGTLKPSLPSRNVEQMIDRSPAISIFRYVKIWKTLLDTVQIMDVTSYKIEDVFKNVNEPSYSSTANISRHLATSNIVCFCSVHKMHDVPI